MSILSKLNPIARYKERLTKDITKLALEKAETIAFEKAFKTNDLSYQTWWEQQYSPITKRDYAFAMERHVWTYVCVYLLSSTIAGIPLRIYPAGQSNDKESEIKSGNDFDLINSPNAEMSYFDMMEALVTYLELTGDGFLEKDDPFDPKQLKVLRSYWCEIFADTRGIYQMQYKPNGVVMATLEPVDYVHFKWFNPLSELYGLGSIQAATDSIINDMHALNYTKKYFAGGGMINQYLKVSKTLGEHEFNRAKREAQDMIAGSKGIKMPVIDSDAEIMNAGFDPSKVLLKEERIMCRNEILACFGVPISLINLLDESASTYNNTEAQKKTFYQATILPKLKKIEGTFNRELFAAKGLECKFDVDGIDALKDDEKNLAFTVASLMKGDGARSVMTPNEIRKKYYNLPPVDGGDTIIIPKTTTSGMDTQGNGLSLQGAQPIAGGLPVAAGSDLGYSPKSSEIMPTPGHQNWTGRQSKTPEHDNLSWSEQNWTADGVNRAPNDPRAGKDVLRSKPEDPRTKPHTSWRGQQDLKYPKGGPNINGMNSRYGQRSPTIKRLSFKKIKEHQELFKAHYSRHDKSLEDSIKNVLKQAMNETISAVQKYYKPDEVKKASEDMVYKIVASLSDLDKRLLKSLVDGTSAASQDFINENYRKFGIPDEETANPVEDPVLPAAGQQSPYQDTNVLDRIRKDTELHIHDWAPSTAEQASDNLVNSVRQTIYHAAEEGDDVNTLTKRLEQVFKGIDQEDPDLPRVEDAYPKARQIARTELTRITNLTNQLMGEEGSMLYKTWITTMDGRERESHSYTHEQTVPVEQDFDVDGTAMSYPGDWRGGAGECVNCRCGVVYHSNDERYEESQAEES